MSKITLNIGLNVGATEPQNQLSATLAALVAAGFVVTDTRIASGEWQGVTERTLVAVVLPPVHIDAKLARLCVMLNQDAVAYYVEEFGAFRLVFPDGAVNAGDRDLFQHIGFYLPIHKGKRYPCGSQWSIGFHEGDRKPEQSCAFFEHVSGEDSRTGGLWIEANELRDYDGVTSLPLAVVARLRGLGVVVDDGYDEA